MLATLTDHYFASRDWIYERKLDGERVLGVRSATSTSLYSRSRQVLDGTYPEIVDALDVQGARDFTVDGEVVAFEGAATSFARLQRRMQTRDPEQARRSGVAVYYYVFDVLHVEGYDVTGLPLRTRKRILRALLSYGAPLRFTAHPHTHSARSPPRAHRCDYQPTGTRRVSASTKRRVASAGRGSSRSEPSRRTYTDARPTGRSSSASIVRSSSSAGFPRPRGTREGAAAR